VNLKRNFLDESSRRVRAAGSAATLSGEDWFVEAVNGAAMSGPV
jgi:hypothetical protein